MMAALSTPSLGEAASRCIDTARTTLQSRQEAILIEIEKGHQRSIELQLKALAGLDAFNILLNYDEYYDTMTPVIYEYYNYLTSVLGVKTERERKNKEFNLFSHFRRFTQPWR